MNGSRYIELRPSDHLDLTGLVPKGSVLTIGNFDGVHIGHQEILKTAWQLARQRSAALVVMTFDPHPEVLLYPQPAPQVLTPLPLKLRLIWQMVDATVITLKDARSILALSAESFIQDLILAGLAPSVIVEGEDFRFGCGRSGQIKTLEALGRQLGFEVKVVPARQITIPSGQSLRVSSTLIRYMLQAGQVADAMLALGRPFRLYGRIVPGRGKGHQLGYPTLNMQRPDQLLPAEGVYAGMVLLGQSQTDVLADKPMLPAVFSIGQAVTFGQDLPILIEAHVLEGLAECVKGTWMAMDFIRYLRPQHKFASAEALANQIAADCQQARQILRPNLDGS